MTKLNDLTSLTSMTDQDQIIEVPAPHIIQCLEAISWTVAPYLDDSSSLEEMPWIVELISSYNLLVDHLPRELRPQWEPMNY